MPSKLTFRRRSCSVDFGADLLLQVDRSVSLFRRIRHQRCSSQGELPHFESFSLRRLTGSLPLSNFLKSMAVNLALMAVSYYPAYHTVQYVAGRDEQGLNKHDEAKTEVGTPETTSRDEKEV